MTNKHEILLEIIVRIVGLKNDDILSKNRKRKNMIGRQLLCYYLRKKFKYKLQVIANILNSHHSSIMHNITAIDNMIYTNDKFTNDLIIKIDKEISDSIINIPKKIIINIPDKYDYIMLFEQIKKNYKHLNVEIVL